MARSSFQSAPKKLNVKEYGDVFFCCMPFCVEAMHVRNMEMSFFGMPVYILDMCPENRDELQPELTILFPFDSSRFSGPCTSSYVKGIQQKNASPCSMKKRHLHAQRKVSSMYNSEAKRQGHLLKY